MTWGAQGGRVRNVVRAGLSVPRQREHDLTEDWELLIVPADAVDRPQELATSGWHAAVVPGTAALALGWEAAAEVDASDVWYRCRFRRPEPPAERVLLRFDGLATLADVWLNGSHLLGSDNMFHAHACDVTGALAVDNELHVRFRALEPMLRARRPRGRWPTRLVSHKNLRFVRTTLIGSMPGFCPPVRPVGPWRPVRIVCQDRIAVERLRLVPSFEGSAGLLEVEIECRLLRGEELGSAMLCVGRDAATAQLTRAPAADGTVRLSGTLRLEHAAPWWPHTHGSPSLYSTAVVLDVGGEALRVELGDVGFRRLERASDDPDAFALRINGQAIFCRGACWTPMDIASLHARGDETRRALQLVRECGMNMLRVSGPMVYESDEFHRLCDELGILVWQDFMFSSMDYPVDDPEFLESCNVEARQLLERVGARPSLAVLCGNNEVAQQAAMMGRPSDAWGNALFDRVLPELCAEHCPSVPYVPSSPSGGAMPFHVGAGPSHYYGVGAYQRPVEDARLARVRFASECLAFSNVPEDETLRSWLGEETAAVHHPRYKERVPRDGGAGWDFADVTDHYVERIFDVDARQVRYADHDRYLRLCRIAVAEVMQEVQGSFRRRESGCGGALVWFLRDLWEGAGWGIVDRTGLPKAPWYALKRAWAPLALWLVDEGIDGLALHADNESGESVAAELQVDLHRRDGVVIDQARRPLELGPRSQRKLSVEGILGRFVDSSYAYRFGPPAHTVVAARLERDGPTGPEVLARTFHLPLGRALPVEPDLGLTATARPCGGGAYEVTARAERFAQAVAVEARGYRPSDAYFHLAPGGPHRFVLEPRTDAGTAAGRFRGRLVALNAERPVLIQVDEAGESDETP